MRFHFFHLTILVAFHLCIGLIALCDTCLITFYQVPTPLNVHVQSLNIQNNQRRKTFKHFKPTSLINYRQVLLLSSELVEKLMFYRLMREKTLFFRISKTT